MKFNIASTILFLILSASFWLVGKFYLEKFYLSTASESAIEEIQNSNDIVKLKEINLMQFANEKRLVNNYNNMLNKAVEIFSALCFLAASFMFFPIAFQKHSNKSLKKETPPVGGAS
jgi:hypothetical protein